MNQRQPTGAGLEVVPTVNAPKQSSSSASLPTSPTPMLLPGLAPLSQLGRLDGEVVILVPGGQGASLVTTFVAAQPLEFSTAETPNASTR